MSFPILRKKGREEVIELEEMIAPLIPSLASLREKRKTALGGSGVVVFLLLLSSSSGSNGERKGSCHIRGEPGALSFAFAVQGGTPKFRARDSPFPSFSSGRARRTFPERSLPLGRKKHQHSLAGRGLRQTLQKRGESVKGGRGKGTSGR